MLFCHACLFAVLISLFLASPSFSMRTSTEFPDWVDANMSKLQSAKQVMMYCTGGIRCERASALLVQKGLPVEKVLQLEGGIHRSVTRNQTNEGVQGKAGLCFF